MAGVENISSSVWGNVTIINDRVLITDALDSANSVSRLAQGTLLQESDLVDLIDDTIYELVPKPVEYPTKPPISGEIRAANWGKIVEFGGSTDPGIDVGASWVPRDHHEYPAIYALNPVYRFYTSDNPLFYAHNAVSYIDTDTNESFPVTKMIWKVDGQEIHRGEYLQMYNTSATPGRKALTLELHNEVGVTSQTLYYDIVDSEQDGDAQGFSSTYQGMYTYDTELKRAVFGDDPRYSPRWIKFKVHYNNTYNGENKKGKFKDYKNPITIDGNKVQLYTADKVPINYDISAYNLETTYGDTGVYIHYKPGPLSIEIRCQFNYRSWGKYRRKFYKNYETYIDPDSSITEDIDLGKINVGKTDESR